ncbi:hypothetical protein AMC82_CH03918 [Rhizobium phaseoli]|uniref:DUF3489 domain-containing protein n=1 Tax=Rhizobium phaseoli TaxID=396 RepID=UPI0007E9A5BA|nr:DUF3489 domain-containing protein [Rhizobium phaseoli]ANL55076.1 hypothetical protein AMC86_CH03994 [Rhizobium phaseoli]ANL67506.1 hypothetical protein AMC84_CH03932 [Rhizobium phaseoli]ANL80319.1 hypothetical protein AMC82_CH03918 [Rhizobium phaseoli]
MPTAEKPRNGTKVRVMYELFHQRGGATLAELNKATGWTAFSYINDVQGIAARYGGAPHWTGEGQTRRFWIEK